MPSVELTSKRQAAREVIDILSEISLLLVGFHLLIPSRVSSYNLRTEHASGPQHAVSVCILDREWRQS